MKKTLLSLAFLAASAASYAQIAQGTMMLGGTLGFGSGSGTNEVTGAATTTSNVSFNTPATSNFSIAPTFGYFLQENLAVGASINFVMGPNTTTKMIYNSTTGSTFSDNGATTLGANQVRYDKKVTNSTIGISLFANKFMSINEKWYYYMGASLGYSMLSGATTSVMYNSAGLGSWAPNDNAVQTATNTISLGANLGVYYFLNKNWALQAGLNNLFAFSYVMATTTTDNTAATNGTTKVSTNTMNLTLGTGTFGLGAVNVGVFYFLR